MKKILRPSKEKRWAGYRTEDIAKFSLGYHEFESRAHLQ